MRRALSILLLTHCLGASAGWAKSGYRGGPREFVPVDQSEQEREARRVRARYKMGTFHEPVETPNESHFPWMQLGLTVLIFGIAAPFGWRAYQQHIGEMAQAPDKPRRKLIRHGAAAAKAPIAPNDPQEP